MKRGSETPVAKEAPCGLGGRKGVAGTVGVNKKAAYLCAFSKTARGVVLGS